MVLPHRCLTATQWESHRRPGNRRLLPPLSCLYPLMQVVIAQGFCALQFILEEKLLGAFKMQVSRAKGCVYCASLPAGQTPAGPSLPAGQTPAGPLVPRVCVRCQPRSALIPDYLVCSQPCIPRLQGIMGL